MRISNLSHSWIRGENTDLTTQDMQTKTLDKNNPSSWKCPVKLEILRSQITNWCSCSLKTCPTPPPAVSPRNSYWELLRPPSSQSPPCPLQPQWLLAGRVGNTVCSFLPSLESIRARNPLSLKIESSFFFQDSIVLPMVWRSEGMSLSLSLQLPHTHPVTISPMLSDFRTIMAAYKHEPVTLL